MIVITMPKPTNPKWDNWPKWKRSFLVNEDGQVFLPAILAGNENNVFFMASWDGGIETVLHKKHLFVPLKWMLSEFPETSDICSKIANDPRLADLIKKECHVG